jgi:hypothetical protein
MPTQPDPSKGRCSLFLLVATPAEEEGLQEEVAVRGLPFERIKKKDPPLREDYHWLGPIGNERAGELSELSDVLRKPLVYSHLRRYFD